MSPLEINWGEGHVQFWDLDAIDERRPLAEQVAELKEDLAQVEYPSGVVLDVGWYPSFSADGSFVVCIALPDEWDQPLFQKNARTIVELKESLIEGIEIAQRAKSSE